MSQTKPSTPILCDTLHTLTSRQHSLTDSMSTFPHCFKKCPSDNSLAHHIVRCPVRILLYACPYVNRDQPGGLYISRKYFVDYCNRVVPQLYNLTWRSSLAPHPMKRFGRAHQGSKVHGLTFNLRYYWPQTFFLCKSSSMVFGPYLLCSF